jgi:hypothetical protein
MKARSLSAGAVALIAIAVVHGSDKSRPTATTTALLPAAIATVAAVLSARASLIAGAVLAWVLRAKITSASPRLAIARLLRLIQSFIHS